MSSVEVEAEGKEDARVVMGRDKERDGGDI